MIPNYNPLHLDGNVGDNGSILQYFTGVQNWIYAEDASFTVRTEFCLDYNAEEKDGKTVVTMHLNPKAKWNSGEDCKTVLLFQAYQSPLRNKC